MKKFTLVLVLFLLPLSLSADTRRFFPPDGGVLAADQPWVSANQVYVFRPQLPQVSLYLFIANKNPTSAHSLTLRVYQTPDPTLTDWTNNQGLWVQDVINGDPCGGPIKDCAMTVPAASMSAVYVGTMFARQISIRLTGAVAQAGSPDTLSIFLVQGIGEPRGEGPGSPTGRVVITDADGGVEARVQATSPLLTDPGLVAYSVPFLWDGTARSQAFGTDIGTFPTAVTLTGRNSIGVQIVEKGSRWAVNDTPATGTKASAVLAAEAGVRHVLDCIAFTSTSSTAPAATTQRVSILDGAATIWSYGVLVTATVGQHIAHSICGLNLTTTTNAALTIEFNVGLANTQQTVNMSGFNVN